LFGDVDDYAEKGGTGAMGDSLDRGHVMALSLWDDVEVNMLWLDSWFPLDKPRTDPGIQRGECPGGEQSTPSYVRANHPDGWVSFRNAYVGPIGSFENRPAPTPAPCVSSCGAAPGKNQPECNGQSESSCKRMMEFESKCSWKECPAPTPAPPTPTNAPTQSPTSAPTLAPTPAPEICRMVEMSISKTKRCSGKATTIWQPVSAEQCQAACIAAEDCAYAVFKNRKCFSYTGCSKQKEKKGFTVWQKVCAEPTPAPTPTPTPEKCRIFCVKEDLTRHGETCSLLNRFEKFCVQSYVRDDVRRDAVVTPCKYDDGVCTADGAQTLECGDLDAFCASMSNGARRLRGAQ